MCDKQRNVKERKSMNKLTQNYHDNYVLKSSCHAHLNFYLLYWIQKHNINQSSFSIEVAIKNHKVRKQTYSINCAFTWICLFCTVQYRMQHIDDKWSSIMICGIIDYLKRPSLHVTGTQETSMSMSTSVSTMNAPTLVLTGGVPAAWTWLSGWGGWGWFWVDVFNRY